MAHKLLLVDDEKDVVELVQKRLVQEGYEVAVAFDGEEGLQKVAEFKPDVIVLDLTMPKRSGLEVLKEVREKYKDKWMPIIILTAKDEVESLEKCYQMEADHYLAKPCTIEQILQAVRTMISLIPARIQK